MKMKFAAGLLLFVLPLILTPLMMASVTFTRDVLSGAPFAFATADLNNDGREDLISVCGTGIGNGNGDFAISLSTADGVYAPQVCYKLPSGTATGIAVGDFNGDGSIDLAVINGTNMIYEYLNDGHGAFHLKASFATQTSQITSIVAADTNHDQHIDLIFNGFNDTNLYVWFGDGKAGFTAGPTSTIQDEGTLSVGDFDGDSNVDVVAQFNTYGNIIQVSYGDGKGHFTATPQFSDNAVFQVYDLNHDGKSDLVGDPFDFSINGSTYYKTVRVWYGNSNRTLTKHSISLSQCTAGASYPAVGDFNGDGIRDLAVVEASDCKGSAPYSINILLGKPDGTYEPEERIYPTDAVGDLYVMRVNRDTKPDLRMYGEFGTGNSEEVLFTDTTPGNFPKCDAPDAGDAITLCSPTRNVVATSPVRFSVGAADQTPGRKVEVWIDGKKAGENYSGWGYYDYFDNSFSLAAGTHTVTLYSVAWDNLLESLTFPLTVGSTTCAPPSTPGLNVCSPLNDSTLGSSVLAWASGRVTGTIARMEVWVDGVKKYSTYGVDTLRTTLSLSGGPHVFNYYIVNTAGQKWEQTVVVMVR